VSFVGSRAVKVESSAAQGERYEPPVGFVITGVMAAGKSTVAEVLAKSFARGVHVRGDVFRKMIVSGRDPIAPTLGDEALRQLDLRQHLAVSVANDYWRDDFNVVLQDISEAMQDKRRKKDADQNVEAKRKPAHALYPP